MSSSAAPDVRRLLRSGTGVGLLSGLSRMLGLLRDVLIAILFGVSTGTDVFFVALSLSQFMRALALEGAVSQTLVSAFTRARLAGGAVRMGLLGARFTSAAAIVCLGVAALMLALPFLPVALFGGGFLLDGPRRALALAWLPPVFLYLLPIVLAGIAVALQNAKGSFAAPAMTPILFNVVLIAALCGAAFRDLGIGTLIFAIPAAGLLQWSFHLWRLRRLKLLRRPRMGFADPDFRAAMPLLGPALLTVLALQLSVPINNLIASFLPAGSLSIINYANRLAIMPVGLIGVAAITVLLPTLAGHHASGDDDGFRRSLNGGLKVLWLLGLPAAVGLYLLAEPIIWTLFGYGRLTADEAGAIARSLQILAPSIPASMLVSMLAGACIARKRPWQPLRIALLLLPISVTIKLLLTLYMHKFWQSGYLGLALGVTLASWINAGLLWQVLRRDGMLKIDRRALRPAIRFGVALAVMAAMLIAGLDQSRDWSAWDWQLRLLRLAALCLGGALVYLSATWLLGERFPRRAVAKSEHDEAI